MVGIMIFWDYTEPECVSYQEGLRLMQKELNFCTNVLDFFSFSALKQLSGKDIIIYSKDGSYISVMELLTNKGNYTKKEIRPAHNIRKMLVAGSFQWKH